MQGGLKTAVPPWRGRCEGTKEEARGGVERLYDIAMVQQIVEVHGNVHLLRF